MECVVHYTAINRSYSTLKSLSENQHQRLLEAKQIREQEVLEENKHTRQCNFIPMPDNKKSRHGVHLEPYYQKFTSILAPSKKRSNTEYRLKWQKYDDSSGLTDLFSKICFYCKKYRKTKKKVTYNARNAEANIKAAAQIKKDGERLIQFQGVDLIEKELMTHDQCYREYTRCLNVSDDADVSIITSEDKGNFEKVKTFIRETMLGLNKAVSMSAVQEIYGTGYRHECERSYRVKLKVKLSLEMLSNS